MQVSHHEHYNNQSHAIMNESQYGNGQQTNIGQQWWTIWKVKYI